MSQFGNIALLWAEIITYSSSVLVKSDSACDLLDISFVPISSQTTQEIKQLLGNPCVYINVILKARSYLLCWAFSTEQKSSSSFVSLMHNKSIKHEIFKYTAFHWNPPFILFQYQLLQI